MKTLQEAKNILTEQVKGIHTDRKINQSLRTEINVKNMYIHHYQDLHSKGKGELINRRTYTLQSKLIKIVNGFAVISIKHYVQDSMNYQVEENILEIDKNTLLKAVKCSLEYWKNYIELKSLRGIVLEAKSTYEEILKQLNFDSKSLRTIFVELKNDGKKVNPSYAWTVSDESKIILDSWISIHNEKFSIQNSFSTCEFDFNESRKSNICIENFDFYYENENFKIELAEDSVRFVSKNEDKVDEYKYETGEILTLHLNEIKERNQITNLLDKPVYHTIKFFKNVLKRINVSEERIKEIVQYSDDIVGNGKTEEEMIRMLSIYEINKNTINKKNFYQLKNMKIMNEDNFVLMRIDTDEYHWYLLGNGRSANKVYIHPTLEKKMPDVIEQEMLKIITNYINN